MQSQDGLRVVRADFCSAREGGVFTAAWAIALRWIWRSLSLVLAYIGIKFVVEVISDGVKPTTARLPPSARWDPERSNHALVSCPSPGLTAKIIVTH